MTSGARTCHLGIDVGTGSVRAALFDAVDGGLVAEHIEPLTVYRSGSRHELDLEAAWASIERALAVLDTTIRASTLRDARPHGRLRVSAIGVSATASTVGVLDEELQPMGRAVLWADHRAATEAAALRQTAHPILARTLGHVSPEWGLPKLMYLWGRGAAPGSARRGRSRGKHIVELLDFVNLRLTGRLVANAGIREWGWLVADDGRWPQDLVDGLGLDGALQLVPREALVTGAVIGRVRGALEKALPFLRDASVVMGGMDSYMAALGQGVVGTDTLAVSVGSSSSIVAATRTGDARGRLYGPMHRILPGVREGYWHGGQSTAGLAVDWVAGLLSADRGKLEAAATRVAPGSDGLVFRETLLDRRTPAPEPRLRGVWDGVTLSHTGAHLYRSVNEGVAFGLRQAAAPLRPTGIVVTGGLAESRLFLDALGSAFGRPIGLLRHRQSAAFGAAFAGMADRAAALNPVIDWVEPRGLFDRSALERYIALHGLPRSVAAAR